MSRQSRELKRKISQRRKILFGVLALFIGIFVLAGYYRSNLNMVLEPQDFLNSVDCSIYFLKDSDYLELDNFTSEDLAVPEGTKVSGYDEITKDPLVVNQTYLNEQIQAIDAVINDKYYENWDGYAERLEQSLERTGVTGLGDKEFFIRSARYSPATLPTLLEYKDRLEKLDSGEPTPITLNNFGVMKTGYIYSSISEYDKLACEAVLGLVNSSMLAGLSTISSQPEPALCVINNDHCYAITSVDEHTKVQGEEQVEELKATYHKDISNSDYFAMLVTRVDRLREFPEISFVHGDKTYPAYLVDVVHDGGKKILILMMKDYIQDIAQVNKLNCEINVQDYRAWVVPQSAIIKRDGNTYLQLLQKGYFVEEVPVNVTDYNRGNAVLKLSDNENLSDGMSIKIYP